MEYRADAGTLSKVKTTTQGGIVVPANLTRTGVFVYDYADGTRVRELRHPDEVFKADSLASLAHATVVVGHPAEINPDNWGALAKGHVSGEPKQDGKFVAADIRVMDRDAIRRVTTDGPDQLVEVSCGYRCNVRKESGVYNGEHYDAVQEGIVYNHVGLGPKDWGRAGNEVKIRLDSGAPAVAWLSPVEGIRQDSQALLPGVSAENPKPAEAKTPEAAPAPVTVVVKTDESDALRGQIAQLQSENARLTTELAAANDSKRIDGLVSERVSLISQVLPVLGKDFKADGLSPDAIRRAALAKLDPTLKLDGESEGYIRGAFASALKSSAAATEALGALAGSTPAAPHVDGKERDAIRDAEREAAYRSANAWRGDSWLAANPFKP